MKKIIHFLALLFFALSPFSGAGQEMPAQNDSVPRVLADTSAQQTIDSANETVVANEPLVSIHDLAEDIRTTRGVPGMAYAVFSKDSILESGVTGYRVFKSKDPIEKHDRFNIGTNTAAFTAYIAARLVEAGKMKWNTPLLKVFPEMAAKTLPVYQTITLQDLLNSRTRLPAFTDMSDWFKIPEAGGDIIAKRRAFTAWILQKKPNMENFNQQKMVFSIAGYVVAAAMMEKVTRRTWEDLVTEYIRKPYNVSVRYSWPNRMDPSAPAGHWFQGGSFHSEDPDTWVKVHPVLYPAQGISISLPDYISYMQLNLRGLTRVNPHPSQTGFKYLYFGIPDYSMGWNTGSYSGQSFAFHEGISLLFNCRTEVLKEKGLAIIVLCNSGDKDGRGAVLDLTHALEERYF